jgi:hypothetical protein
MFADCFSRLYAETDEIRTQATMLLTLPQSTRRVRNFRHRRNRFRHRPNSQFRRRRRSNSQPLIHFLMILAASRTKSLPGLLIPKTGQLITPMNAIAITSPSRSLNSHQSHQQIPPQRNTIHEPKIKQAPVGPALYAGPLHAQSHHMRDSGHPQNCATNFLAPNCKWKKRRKTKLAPTAPT